jgi:hypothetical protein
LHILSISRWNKFARWSIFTAAFVGMNWEQGKSLLAQAPEPASGATSTIPYQPFDRTMSSNDISAFASSWSKKLKALTLKGTTVSNNNATSMAATQTAISTSTSSIASSLAISNSIVAPAQAVDTGMTTPARSVLQLASPAVSCFSLVL